MADKKFNVEFNVSANISSVKQAAEQLQTLFSKIPANLNKGADVNVKKLLDDINELQRISAGGVISGDKLKTAQRLFERITESVDRLNVQTSKFKGIEATKLLPPDVLAQFKKIENAAKKLHQEIENGFKSSEGIKSFNAEIKKTEKAIESFNEKKKKAEQDIKPDIASLGSKKGALTKKINKYQEQLDSGNIKKDTKEYQDLAKAIEDAKKARTDLDNQIKAKKNDIEKQFPAETVKEYNNRIKECRESIAALQQEAQKSGLEKIAEEIDKLQGNEKGTTTFQNYAELETALQKLPEQQVKDLRNTFQQVDKEIENCATDLNPIDDEINKASSAADTFNEKEREMAQLANQVKQFFSIGNTVQLFKRAIRSAFDTIKELDEVMTQTAVVTDFTVGDMWNQLPEYTRRANELGVSVKGAYEAATLYYQQGLKTNQVIGVSNETLKMAKIAGIEYATATDYMTSALRGFNMEVNEDSARKVNDIYSELAAVTAADTAELSIAMSKTASLASNAGMEIETTTALLAKMIETTREAPETLGTAMKTVIARFQELKKDPALIEPVEGEIVDANKIEAALRTIDVALRDSSGQFRDLDDVFLDIAEKWDDLDTNTQRYIATIAAGSRQQSRFIAMMTDYPRTMELVESANTSAGASQRQFEKTLDSMATALDRLKNAWNQFTMGLANNQIVKAVINAIREFINILNKLTDSLSFGSGFLKSFWNLGALLGGIKLAKGVFTGFFGWLTKSGKIAGAETGTAIGNGIISGINKAKHLLAKTTWITPTDFKKNLAQTIKAADIKNDLARLDFLPNSSQLIQNYQKELAGLTNAQKLTNEQTAVYNYLTGQGVDKQLAMQAATKGVSIEKAKETVTTKANTTAEIENNNAKAKSLIFGQAGIATKAKNIALLLFSTKATKAETFARLAENAAVKEGTLSYKMLSIAMKGLPLGWLIAGIAAVVAIVAVLMKISKDNTLESKLKAAQEATDLAKKSAEEAKAAYDELVETKSGFDELQQSLKDLTYGTLEWRQALLEANQQVIDLIDKYPELVKYLSEGEYGQLTITTEGWDFLLEQQQQNVQNAQGAQVIAQTRENRIADQYAKTQFYNTDISGIVGNRQRDLLRDIQNYNPATQSIEEFAASIDVTTEQATQAYAALQSYNNAIKENELQTESAAASFVKMTAAEAGLDNTSSDYLSNELGNQLAKGKFEGSITANKVTSTDIYNELIDTYGIRSLMTGDTTENLALLYATMTNQAVEDLDDEIKKSDSKLKQAIADVYNAKQFNDYTDDIIKQYQQLSNKEQAAINMATSEGKAFVSEAENLTETEIEALYDQDGVFQSLIDSMYGSFDDYAKAYETAIENGKVEIEEARGKLTEYGIWTRNYDEDEGVWENEFGQKLSAGAISGLADRLNEVFKASGLEAAQGLANQINDITSVMDPQTAEQFASALNSIDWKNKNEIRGFSEKIKDLGDATGLTDEEIDDLEKEIMQLAKASSNVNLDTLIDQIKSLGKIQLDLTQNRNRNFSEDAYNTLVNNTIAKAEDFVYSLETGEYIYTGKVDDLIGALDENTAALLGIDDIERQVHSSEIAKSILNDINEGTQKVDVESVGSLYNILKQYVLKAGDSSIYDMDYLQSLYNTKDLEGLKDFWNQVVSEGTALATRQEQLNTTMTQARAIEYQNDARGVNLGRIQDSKDFSVGSEGYAASQALIAQAEAVGVNETVIREFTDALNENNAALIKEKASMLSLTIAATKQTTGIKNLANSYDEWDKVLRSISGKEGGIKGLVDTNEIQAIEDLKKNLMLILDTTEPLSDAFFENAENLALIEGAAKNDKEAIEQLRIAAGNQIIAELKINHEDAKNELDELNQLLANYPVQNIEAGAYINDTAFINTLNHLIEAAGLTATEVNNLLENMGFDVSIGYKYVDLRGMSDVINSMSVAESLGTAGAKKEKIALSVPGANVPTIRTVRWKGAGSPSVSIPSVGGSGGGGGGGGSDNTEEWKNPYDWLYNLTKKINAELRIREKLEQRYQRLLKQYKGSGAELKSITDKEIASLEKRLKLEEEMVRLRKQEANEYLSKNTDLQKYATIDWDLNEVQINWDLIDPIKDTELGEKIEEFINKLQDIVSEIQNAEDAIEDITDEVIELKQRGKDQYRDLEDRVLSALISERQEQIDEQDRINKAITDAANDLTDAISKNVEKIRQDRQNEETEISLAEKERRLAYLRQDTTGSNALDIKKLEKEIADEKQNYTDSLIDQGLNDLKEQNDAAAKQRDKQIELMQSELDWREKTGYYVQEATDIVRDGLGPNGVIDKSSRMYELLREQEDVSKLSNASRDQWFKDLYNTISEAFVWFSNGMGVTGEGANRDIMSEMIARVKQGKAVNTDMSTLAKLEDERNAKIANSGSNEYPQTDMVDQYEAGKTAYQNGSIKDADIMKIINEAMEAGNWKKAFKYAGARDQKLIDDGAAGAYASDWTFQMVFNKWYSETKGKAYKHGGLVDFTGPAWLDGTKTNPEMVLNAKDTQNLIELKNILAGYGPGALSASSLGGDWYFDIDINVDEIASDYDVDQVAERVKQSIYEETTYRNVNAIKFLK